MNVKTTVRYNCGCGYSTEKTEEAIQHVENTGHCMSAHGELRKEDKQ